MATQAGLGRGGGSGGDGGTKEGGCTQGPGREEELFEVCVKLAGGGVPCDLILCLLLPSLKISHVVYASAR